MSQGTSVGDAKTLVDTGDRERAAFIQRYFDLSCPNHPVYHAMVDTALGDETVIQTYVSSNNAQKRFRDTPLKVVT